MDKAEESPGFSRGGAVKVHKASIRAIAIIGGGADTTARLKAIGEAFSKPASEQD